MSSSPHLFKMMGLGFTRSMIDKTLEPENKLWRAVVLNAFDDTLINASDRKASLQKINAHNWIIHGSRDYEIVCEWALLDADEMKQHYINALKRRVMYFNKKQIRWSEYHRIYCLLDHDIDPESKKHIRRKLDVLREEIHNTEPVIIYDTILTKI